MAGAKGRPASEMIPGQTTAEVGTGLRTLASWSLIAWVSLAASAVVSTAILFRLVGPADYGIWATVLALKGFAMLLDGGLAFSASTDASRYRAHVADATARVRGTLRLGIVGGAAAALTSLAFAWLPSLMLGLDGVDASAALAVMLVLGLDTGLALALSPVAGAARGLERFDLLAAGNVVQAVLGPVLTVVLAPTLGILGAAIAMLLARGVASIVLVGSIHRRYRGLIGIRGPVHPWRDTIRFAGPIWLLALGTTIALGTDVPIVAAFFGPVAAGAYALGAVVPRTAVGVLFSMLDSAYPRIARSGGSDARTLARLLRTGTLLAGLGLGITIIQAPSILSAWVGVADPLAVQVLRLYALAWALNVPAHLLSLQAMATGHHRMLIPVVLGEAAACFALSLFLASVGVPAGPAVATVLTLSISNLIVVPLVMLPHAPLTIRTLTTESLTGYTVGAIASLGVAALVALIRVDPLGVTVASAVGTAVAAVAILYVTLRRAATVRRWLTLVMHDGIRTWVRQQREVQRAKHHIIESRSATPIIFLPASPPLVTVRIATFDRGALVRDRAISSALEQTYPNIEIVVVGDHCDAATEAAVRSVKDRRVRFENLAVRGRYPRDPRYRWMVAGSAPMNRALELARGEWIAPLDDDDEFTPDHVEVLLDACRTRSLEFAYGIAATEVEPGTWTSVGGPELRHGAVVHAAVLFWKPLGIIRHDLESWRLDEPADWNVWHRMRDAGARIGFVDRVVTRHYLERRELR